MKAKIVNLEAQKAVGMVYRGMNENGEIPALWQVFNKRYNTLSPSNNACYGLCYMDADNNFAYMAGVTVDDLASIPEDMEVATIPGGKYAVFTFTDHISQIKGFWDRIYTEFLPQQGLVATEAMSFELYDGRFSVNGELDIYIPVL